MNLVIGGFEIIRIIVTSSYMKFYTDIIGLSPGIYAIVFLIFSIWNGINDPIIGYWADLRSFQEGKGKYSPLIRWSIPVIGFSAIILLFASPGWNEIFTAGFLLVFLIIYEGAQTALGVSFQAFKINTFLSMEERSEVQAISVYVVMLPVFLGGMLPIWLFTGDFSRMTIVMLFSGAIAIGLVFILIGSRFIKEDPKFYEKMEMTYGLKELLKLFLQLCKDETFLLFVLAFFFINSATSNYFTGYIYYMDNVLEANALQATIPDIITGLLQLALLPFIVKAVKKYGSRKTLFLGLLLSVVAHVILTFQVNYWIAAVTFNLMLAGYAFNTGIFQPFQGLVVDHIELETGKRQPGVVGGMMMVLLTIASSVQPLILGLLLDVAGYDGAVQHQNPQVVSAIRFGAGLIPAIILVIGIILLRLLPIDHNREKEIQEAIEEKHGITVDIVEERFINPEGKKSL